MHIAAAQLIFFLLGDILQFAGIAMAILALLKKLTFYPVYVAFLCFLVVMASPLLWNWHHSNVLIDHLLHLIGGQPADTFFPLFPWLVYPLAGLLVGCYFQSPLYSAKAIFFSGCFLLLASLAMRWTGFHFPETSFYRTWPDATNMHLGFVLIWITAWFWMAKKCGGMQPYSRIDDHKIIRIKPAMQSEQRVLIEVLCFCSRNITSIYLLQWVLIFWFLPVAGYQELDLLHALFYGINITAVIWFLVWLLSKNK